MSIIVKPLRWWENALTTVFVPVMYLCAGTLREKPQQTHFWNNKRRFTREEIRKLRNDWMVSQEGIPDAIKKGLCRFHIPVLGGWRNYVVIKPTLLTENCVWYPGWQWSESGAGCTRIECRGPVRLLVGPNDIKFFGLTPAGEVYPVECIGSGRIGQAPPEHSSIPLL